MKGLLVSIYRSGNYDASNGGISAQNKNLVWVGEGAPQIFDTDGHDAVVIESGIGYRGETRHVAYPANRIPGQRYMFGGTYISTSDSRFARKYHYPVPLHDRVE